MKYSLAITIIFVSTFAVAQGWNDDNAAQNAEAAGAAIKSIAKIGLTLCGLVGSGISGYKVFAEGNQTWQIIAGFCISLVVLAIALSLFA